MEAMVAVVVSALNEEVTIRNVIKAIPKNIVSHVIVVDDASHDGTPGIVKEVGAVVVCHGRNLGVGAAIKTGYSKALDRGSDIVVVVGGVLASTCLFGVLALLQQVEYLVACLFLSAYHVCCETKKDSERSYGEKDH